MANSDYITIKKSNSTATVHLFGATLTSWKPNGVEALFVSEKSLFDNQTPIRGGVPVVFPQFGPWECGPQHGFARRLKWSVKDEKHDPTKVTLVLEDSDYTLKLWNYRFIFEYTVHILLDTELLIEAFITNRDEKEFNFTFLLHNYFSVPNIEECAITGLKNSKYIDKVKDGVTSVEENEEVRISEFTDRIYLRTFPLIKVGPISSSRQVSINKLHLPDVVVWNPWKENAEKMSDFGDDEYKRMVCVEAGYVGSPRTLISGDTFMAGQLLKIRELPIHS